MKGKTTQLKTEHLILHPLRDEDQERMVAFLCDAEIGKTYMLPKFFSEEEKAIFFHHLKSLSQDEERFIYGIYLDELLIGFINEVDKGEDFVELGYFIDPAHWNKGYATEALKVCIQELFGLGIDVVKASHFEENLASGRVMEKTGMRKIEETGEVKYKGKMYRLLYYAIQSRNDCA